mmetsp:Transcript_22990/g.38098  ORF Transcript_22990/g.38098 Transcript_22990/m.38098 type:complete len:339 (-) Transcript_22990:749-1765(-)
MEFSSAWFSHITLIVIDEIVSTFFYTKVLGFEVLRGCSFGNENELVLHGHGLALHLLRAENPDERLEWKNKRKEHFQTAMPKVDHFAFISNDLPAVEKVLIETRTYFKKCLHSRLGLVQLFVFGPDGNVIEISNCGVPVDASECIAVTVDPATLRLELLGEATEVGRWERGGRSGGSAGGDTEDAFSLLDHAVRRLALPIARFDHFSNEVMDVDAATRFYVEVLSFREVVRPDLDGASGKWLHGHGLNLHLVRTDWYDKRKLLLKKRQLYFHKHCPFLDKFSMEVQTIQKLNSLESSILRHNQSLSKNEEDQIIVYSKHFFFTKCPSRMCSESTPSGS